MTGTDHNSSLTVDIITSCPLCGSEQLQPFGAAPPTALTLHPLQTRCAGCGLLVSTPRASDGDRDRYYEQSYYQEQWPDAARVFRENTATYAEHDITRIERVAGTRLKPGRALDVGSGYGATVDVLRRKGFRAIGSELSWHACAFARTRDLPFVRAKVPGVPFLDGMFDLVMSAHVIEHVGDPLAFVCELARVVRPGGCLALITDHAITSQHRWDRFRATISWRVAPFQTSTDHTFVSGAKHLTELLSKAGCTDIQLEVYDHRPPPEHWHWRAYKTVFRVVDRVMGWGPYQLAIGVRAG